MTIAEMHVWFRQYAQQMGLQNVRAILPEQIDLLINTSITDVVNQLVRENLGVVNDRIVTDNSKIGQINAFRTLYKVAELPITEFVEAPAITKQYELTLDATLYGPYWALYYLDDYNQKMLIYVDSSNNIFIPFDERENLVIVQDDFESFTTLEISDASDISDISTDYLQFDNTSIYTRDTTYSIAELGVLMGEGKIKDYTGAEIEDYRYGLALCYRDESDIPQLYSYVPDKTDVSGVITMLQNFVGIPNTSSKYIKKIEVVQYTPAIYVNENNKQDGYICINVTYSGPFNFYISDYNRGEDPSAGVIWDPMLISENWDDAPLHRLFGFTEDSPYTGLLKGVDIIDNFFYLVDFAINYKKAETGYKIINDTKEIEYVSGSDAFTTNYFPVRLIDDSYLADTLNDFILKPKLRSPVLVIYGDNYDLYVDKFAKMAGREGKDYFLANKLMPYKFRVSYIAKPATVKYSEDVAGDNVDCDLPESLHIDILKHAVDLYRTSISNNLYGAQQQDRAQQQELARNAARPTNDGYQN